MLRSCLHPENKSVCLFCEWIGAHICVHLNACVYYTGRIDVSINDEYGRDTEWMYSCRSVVGSECGCTGYY